MVAAEQFDFRKELLSDTPGNSDRIFQQRVSSAECLGLTLSEAHSDGLARRVLRNRRDRLQEALRFLAPRWNHLNTDSFESFLTASQKKQILTFGIAMILSKYRSF